MKTADAIRGEMDGGGDSALSRGAGNELKENPPLYGRGGISKRVSAMMAD